LDGKGNNEDEIMYIASLEPKRLSHSNFLDALVNLNWESHATTLTFPLHVGIKRIKHLNCIERPPHCKNQGSMFMSNSYFNEGIGEVLVIYYTIYVGDCSHSLIASASFQCCKPL